LQENNKVRTGIGYDIHRLVEERKLFLGGVEIPYIRGLLGHSDGDVLIHAVSDALLGALALGDIGEHFSNTDPQYKGVASGEILRKVMEMVKARKFRVNNVDAVVIAEEPNIQPFKERMAEGMAKMLEVTRDSVSIKATTNEGVGSLGRGEAIAVFAVASLEEIR
jgi:2-C-methyl-D-erythritol 2,4-cyclodiphosphate synthase